MKENYEIYWKDYYEILQVHTSAEPEVIKVAYLKLVQKYNTDQHTSKSEQKWKDLNEAYEILGHPSKKFSYDTEHSKRDTRRSPGTIPPAHYRPKPKVHPPIIRIVDVVPGETKKAVFVISNEGSPFSKIRLSKPNDWIKIPRINSLSSTTKLPLEIGLELTGDEWGKSYSDNIIVKLDDEETHVRIEFSTVSKDTKSEHYSTPLKTRKPRPARKKTELEYSLNPPGPFITTLTPTLQWGNAPGADYYCIWVQQWADNAWDIVYGPEYVFGDSIILPSGILIPGGRYFWFAAAYGMDANNSGAPKVLYFQT